ncbi:hypothetical protein ABEB36_007377 [Hypothenemus hampei]|uniref:Acyltransferase 3 domain-containing protein n=1 Tax=Hypothenemus hampei TaxID=57062 RepID=A0ABD1ETW8_HYPHA
MVQILCLIFSAVAIFGIKGDNDISEVQYALMPELFYLDNYDLCMLNGETALFCTFVYHLQPVDNDTTIWVLIQNISSNPQNYRHDLLRHGICVPTHCDGTIGNTTKEEIEVCYNMKFEKLALKGHVSNLKCQTSQSPYTIDEYNIIFGAVLLLYLLFVLFASFYERFVLNSDKMHLYQKNLNKGNMFIAAFSIPKNWIRLRSNNTNPDHRKLKCIQGIRFYNMICVIMTHTIMAALGGPVANTLYTENTTRSVLNMLIANGWYAIQTFFVISGWLLSYHFYQMLEDMKKIKFTYIFVAIFNRYLRLAPSLAIMVGIHGTWLVHLSRGPYWDEMVGQEYRNCRKNGWTNLLFVNNYVDSDNMCLHQTWYIAADMQLFIMAIVILFFTSHYPKQLKRIFILLLVIGFLTPGIVHHVFWWFLTFGMCISLILIAVIFYDPTFEVTPLKSAFYWSCGKNIFALGIAIGIFGFTRKIGWFARWFCEFHPVQILGRLTYSAYIVHVAIIRWEAGYKRYPTSANDGIIFVAVLGDVVCSYLAGVVLCLLIEMPVSALQKLLASRSNRSKATLRKYSEKSLETLDMTSDINQT